MLPAPGIEEILPEKKIPLTIYLLIAEQVEAFAREVLHANQEFIPLSEPLNGVFVPLEPAIREPLWVPAIRTIIDARETPLLANFTSRSPSGLLVIWRAASTFVLPFGQGAWLRLSDDWLERDFGRRVALNAVPPDSVIWIKAEQFLAKWHLSSERAPRASSVTEFGVDFERDLVSAVEGVPTLCPILGDKVSGGTSLHVTQPLAALANLLDECVSLFGSEAYQAAWPDIDNIRRIDGDATVARLDAELESVIAGGQGNHHISMFTPSQKRGESIVADSYVYGRNHAGAGTTPYLTFQGWSDFLVRKNLRPSVEQAKRTAVHILDEHGESLKEYRTFECFGHEANLDGRVCILSSGTWYHVRNDFVARINRVISAIPLANVALPAWNGVDDEKTYNVLCATDPQFLNCDRVIFRFGGLGANFQFEFCDLINIETKTLFFVKKGSKSSGMSHLFEQVRRTVEPLFGADSAYRQRIADLFGTHHPDADTRWLQSRLKQGEWMICMVSLGDSAVSLPFFARCALVRVFEELDGQGHAVSFISV